MKKQKSFPLVLERPQCDNASIVSGMEFQSGVGGNRKLGRRWRQVVWLLAAILECLSAFGYLCRKLYKGGLVTDRSV